MAFVRAKHARSSDYVYSKKRSFISILLVSTLISTSLGTGVAALENPDQGVQIPALCDPALIAQPVQVSPSPTPTPTETLIGNPETSPSPTPEIPAPTPEPTPTPEVTPTPTPTPSPEFLSGDYVAPIIPAAEFSTTIKNSEVEVSPKIICPSPVTNVIVKPQNTQLEISWIPGVSAEPNTIENITDYYVKVLETAQVIKVSADRTSTIISGLTNETSYSIIVYAASEYGSSVASDLVTAIPLSGNEGEVAGIIVEFKPEANVEQGQLDVPGEELVSQVELTIENKITEDVHVVEFSEATTLEEAKTIANEISQDPQVVWAEPDQFVYTSSTEVINDPNYSTDQWNLWDKYGIGIGQTNKEMTTAWSLTAGQGINVAVIDTGITSHPDLDSQVIKGFDFVSDPEFLKATREENGPQVSFDGDYINSEKYGSLGWDDNPQDPGDWRGVGPVRNSTWHGTHIAGVIAAQSENQEGIAGIAPGAKIQPIRALSWRGGLLSDIASSITWASGGSVTGVADNSTPAKVINMSFSVNSICPTSLQTAINDAFARGSVLVAAAGNNNDDVKNYAPANCENVISVGASNKDGKRASYSNYGLGIDVSAPGGDANDNGIYSTANTGLTEPASFGYASQQGTSISAAHVSAIAARILSANPTFNPTEVKSQIVNEESVREFADTQCDIDADIYCGEGIVSLFQVAAACSTSDSTYTNGGITYNVRRFLNTGTCEWTTPSGLTRVNLLIVGGGGAGGGGIGGGGGAGEFIEITNSVVTGNTSYSITVGAGGTSLNNWASGNAGASSSFASITAFGGGGGGTNSANGPTASGGPNFGSQGGGGYENTSYTGSTPAPLRGVATRSDGITGFRNNGGAGSGQGGANATAGGGGGAGGGGSNAGLNNGGNGGSGKTSSITGSSTFYAAGGGGGVNGATQCPTFPNPLTTGAVGSGGSSIGGNGGLKATSCGADGVYGNRGDGTNGTVNANGSPGATNTGSGGGGASNWVSGGVGGSGIVIVTYENAPTIASATISGTQKIGNTLTATAGSTTGTISSTSYQWQFSNDGSTSWTDISGATSSTYAISGTTYRDKYLRAAITVTNTSGTATAFSSATSQIYYADCSPATTSPTIDGVVRTVYSFTTGTCDWSVPAGVSIANVLVVGGGGGAGGAHDNASSGGGGAGYVYANSTESISGKILITVGAGGTGGVGVTLGTFQNGNTGGDSIFGSVTALGGAGGFGGYESFSGGSCPTYTIPVKGGTAATLIQRATGGQDGCNTRSGFGGGGQNSTQGQTGGTGLASSITGSSITYGTGGAGGTRFSNTSPAAQSSGTGNGGTGANAASSTGRTGGAGGSGIVIVSIVTSSPTITAISPSTGSITAGGSVTITGTNFVSGQTTATINGVSLTSVNVTSATSMTATLPNLTVGTHNLVVNNGTGSATSTGAFTVLAAPTIGSATISGTTAEGQTLTAAANTVTGTSVTTTYQWQSATTSGGSYSNISGATSSTYVLTSSEATKFLKVIITVTNAGGSASATSSATAVIQGNQSTLTLTSTSGTFGSALSLTTSGGSGDGSVTYVASTGTASSCTVSGTSLTAGSAGTCLVTATKASSTNYLSASSVQTTVTFARATQSALTFTSASSVTYGNTLSLVAEGGSSTGSTTYAVSSGTCTISGSTLTPGDAGSSCIITATKAADTNYNSITTSTQTITINKATQSTLSMSSASSVTYGNTLALTSSGGSGTGSTTYAVSSGTCTISGSTLTPGDAGSSCIITATKASDTNYNSVTTSTQTITVNKANQSTLTISSTSGTFGTTLTLTTSGGSGTGSVTYVATTGTASSCTVSGTSLTAGSAGTCLVTATKAADTNYLSATSVQTTVTFAKANQSSLSISSTSGTFGSALTLTTSGGTTAGSVLYSVTTGTASTCTESGGSLTAGSAGTCLVTATMAGSGSYETVSSSQTTITFAQASQSTLTVSSTSGTYGSALTLTTSGGSGTGSVTYAAATGTASSCTVSGTSLTAGSAGTCLVTATKAADTNYSAVSSTQTTVTFAQLAQSTLTVSSTSGTFGTALTLTTSGGSGTGSVTYSAATGTASSCTVSGTSLTAGSAGTCLVTATKASSTNYLAVDSSQTTVTFAQAAQSTLTVSSTSGTYGSALTLTTSGGSGTGSVTYSVTAGTASSCTESGGSLTAGSAGTCLVTATKASDTNYLVKSSTQTTVTFSLAAPTIASATFTGGNAVGETLTASANTVTGFFTTTTYQWQSATAAAGTYSNISSATSSTYVLTSTELNKFVRVVITVTNTGGTATATSISTPVIVAAQSAWAVLAAGERTSVFAETTLNTTTLNNGTYFYNNSAASIGFAPTSTVSLNSADTTSDPRNAISCTEANKGDQRLSWHRTSLNITYGWRYGCTVATSAAFRAVYQATTLPSYYPSGPQKNVSTSTLQSGGWSLCYVGTYAASIAFATISASCTGTYILLSGGPGVILTTPTLSGFSNTSALFSESTKAITAPTASVAGTFSYSSSNTAVASFASASTPTATLVGVGTATITATFTPTDTANYSSTTTTMTLTVSQGNQSTLTVSSTSGTFGTDLTLTTSGGSGTGSVTYVATTGTASSCTVSGTSLTAGSAGTCLVTATKASSTNYLSASSVQTTVTFAKANQSSLSMTSASSVTYGNTLALTSTGGSSTGSTTYSVSSGTCTISSSTLTPGDAGSSCVITATKAADTNYNSVTSSTQTITINKANQSSLTIDSAASVAFGSTLTLSATGGSGTGSVTYAKTGTCTISGSTLTPGDAGSSCVVTATKALDTNYNAISSATQTITITKINQSALTISSTSGTFGSALTLTTSGGTTAGSVTYSVSDGTATTCAISTGSLSVASAGTCLVTATMAGNTNYNAVVSTQTTITFAKASQSSLTVTSTSGTYGSTLTLTTSGGSGDGAVTYVATPGTASSCTVSGSTLTAGSGGTCLVTATKATSTNYLAVSSSQTTVSFGNQAVSLSGFSDISSKNYGDTAFTLTAPTVAGSVAGAFTYSSGTTSVATISGSTVTIVGAGTSTITATFTPTDTGRYSSQTITMLLTVNKKAITVTAVDKTKVYAQATPTNSFTNSTLVGSDAISSLTYTYSGTNSTSAPTTVGNYTITPSSASFSTGSINNYTITYVPSAYSITKATPTFTGFNNVSKTYGDSSFTITAPTVTGSIAGSFAYSSSDTSAITISSATATVAGTGSSLITASFTPTDTTNYNSATTTMTISVAKATQSSLSITSASSVNYGSTISLTSSGGSGTGAISFAVTSGTCSISSTTLTPGNAGSTCVIQATKALDTNYNVATSSTQTITINKINQTVSFTSTAPSSPVSGDTYTPLASATSGAIPTISVASSSSSVCSLSAGIVTFNTSGTCLIEADSASSTNYNAALTASQSITVAKIAQTITFNQPSASSFGDSSRSMSASASSGLAITYSRGASTTNTACSVSSSGVVTILAVGNCEVTAAQSGNSQYDSALSVSRTFAVNAIVPSAPFLTSVSAGNTNATVSFTAPSSNGGANLSAYEIVAMPTSGSNITKSNCSTSASPLACTITGLTNGVSYTFKVAAINSAGTGAYSTTSGSFTPATIANSVVNLVAQPGDGTLIVNWDQPTNLGGGSFTRYDVYYKSTGSYPGTPNAQINSVSTTTTTFSGLTNGTSYDVKVVAITSANASELAGNTAEVSQYPSTVPSAPTSVTVSKLTGTSARISWGLPLTDGGAALDATTPYVATITGGPSPITCGALSGRSCDITGLTPATTYSVSVKAQNRMGLGNAGTTSYLVPSDDANLLSFDLKTGATLSDPAPATYSPSFSASTTSYSVTVANTQAYARITPTINEATATIKINGIAVVSGVARNLSLGIGANVFTVEVTAGDLTTTKTYTLTVTRPKASQMPISITSANSVNYGSTITLTTTGGSGSGLVSFATTGTCTTSFSGGNFILTPGDVGSSCSIIATKATDDDYFSASSTSQTITINKTTPTLSGFTAISKTYGDPSFSVNEPNVSGNAPGTFTYSSSNTSVATISSSTITVAGYGTSTITATFTPTSSTNYNSTTTSLVITVAKKALRVTPGDKTKFYGASHPTLTNSVIGLVGSEDISSISYTYTGTGSTTYSASTTNPTETGTYSITPVITALTSGSLSNYEITYDTTDFTISKVNQSALSITSSTSVTFGVNLTLAASGGSGTGAVTFTKVSGDCTLNTSGSTYSITPGDAGNNCVINATKAADTNHNSVSTSNQTITIGKANQSLNFTSSASSTKVNDTYTPVATSTHSSTGVTTSITPSITIDSDSADVCSITGGIVTFAAAGSCVINADAIASTNYNSATTTSQTLTITVVPPSNSNSSNASSPTPTPSPSAGLRPNATNPIIRNVIERPLPEIRNPITIPNLPQINSPALRPVFPSRTNPTIPNNLDTGLAITDNLGRLPLSEPGEKQIKIGNDFVPVIENVSPQGAMTLTIPETINVAPIEVAIQTTDIRGQNIPAPDDGIIRAVKGQTITVSGDGLIPGSKFSVWLFSEPTKLGEGKVSDDSTFNKVFFVPDKLPTGSHTLQINGINSDQKVISLTTGVILTEVKQIQTVGDSNSEIIAFAILFIFFLLLIIAILLRYIRKQQLKFLV